MRRLVSPQRCLTFNPKQIQKAIDHDGYVFVQAKIDGVRCLIFREAGKLHILSREGIPFIALQSFAEHAFNAVEIPDGFVVEAEFKTYGISFQEMNGHARRHEPLDLAHWDKSYFHPFACVPLATLEMTGDKEFSNVDSRSLALLIQGTKFLHPPRFTAFSLDEIDKFYSIFLDTGFEGAVIKEAGGAYRNGKKVGWWRKVPLETLDGRIIGFEEGEKKLKGTLGAIVVQLESGIVCKAGSGFDDGLRNAIWANPDDYLGRCVELECKERYESGVPRQPIFKCFRDFDYAKGEKL